MTLCIYCQAAEATTVDHVPPRNLFPSPRPALITVPACAGCNHGASLDDEYFRSVMVGRAGTEDNPAAEQLRAAVLRSFDRRDGFRKGWFSRTRLVDIVNESGEAVDSKMQVQPDYDRMSKVLERIVRGLHYHHCGFALPVDCPILVMQDWALDREHWAPGTKFANFIANFDDTPAHVIHPDVFSYKRESVVGEELTAAWLLMFFRHIWALVLVNVEGKIPE